MALTADQLLAIDRHLRKDNLLLNEALITELTDHYIAGLEDLMSTGTSFEKALAAIHTGFGGRKGLLALEEKSNEQVVKRLISEFMTALLLYARPPRLVLSLLILTFAFWANQENRVTEWAEFVHTTLHGALVLIALSFFVWHGLKHITGRRTYIKPFTPLIYQLLTACNIPTIFNGVLAITSLRTSFAHYSLVLQTTLIFSYLLIWAVIIEIVVSSLLRFTRLLTTTR